jgi:hypothetical protein
MTNYKYSHKFRQDNQYSKEFYNRLCKEFTESYIRHMKTALNRDDIQSVSFEKLDMRGAPSISLWGSRHCVPHQRHFENMAQMREFMIGFLVAKNERF